MVRGSSARVVGEHEVVPLEAHLLDGLAHLGDELLGEGRLLRVDHGAAVAVPRVVVAAVVDHDVLLVLGRQHVPD